ncbi:sensor histidine kinase [Bacillus alkalicellulosilyticus]|uniref:sensor histidine kinase n=1 Tax=Alkalihalobacterium alkalicellulosilyticum TaxID=1912214 RepID=UPI0009975105|nr:ATP-binding protein [Bacillus alkalicellulosilyticus]
MNIRTKIQIVSTVTLLLLVGVINTTIYLVFNHLITEEELSKLQSRTENIVEVLQSSTEIEHTNLLRAYLPGNGMIRVINEDQRSITTITKEPDLRNAFEPTYIQKQLAEVYHIQSSVYAVVYFPIIWVDGRVVTLEVTEEVTTTYRMLDLLKYVLLLASFVVVVPAFLAGRVVSTIVLQPINRLITTMEEVRQQGVFKRLPFKRKSEDELFKLGNTFNEMISILEQNYEKQQQFVSDASHELKTPLTVIESYASLLKRWGASKPEVLEESIEAIHSEAVRMKEMAIQMLALANNQNQWDIKIEKVDVVKMCEEISKTIHHAYEREIIVNSTKTAIVEGDIVKLKQLFFILLDNAMKFSNGSIEIDISSEKNLVTISVKDEGVGIPEAEVGHIFDRFYRVDKARSRDNGGTGLGLAIAKKITEAHQGTINVESKEGEGTVFYITLPVLQQF